MAEDSWRTRAWSSRPTPADSAPGSPPATPVAVERSPHGTSLGTSSRTRCVARHRPSTCTTSSSTWRSAARCRAVGLSRWRSAACRAPRHSVRAIRTSDRSSASAWMTYPAVACGSTRRRRSCLVFPPGGVLRSPSVGHRPDTVRCSTSATARTPPGARPCRHRLRRDAPARLRPSGGGGHAPDGTHVGGGSSVDRTALGEPP